MPQRVPVPVTMLAPLPLACASVLANAGLDLLLFFFFLTLNRRRLAPNRRCWPMINRSYSPAGALWRFECTGRRLFCFFSLKDTPGLCKCLCPHLCLCLCSLPPLHTTSTPMSPLALVHVPMGAHRALCLRLGALYES